MTPVIKNSLALALVGTITVAAASPTLARTWRPATAAGAGFVAGATAANAAAYGPAYQAYTDAPGQAPAYPAYAYAPGQAPAYQAYAYAPGQAPAPGSYGYGNYRSDGSDGISGCATVGNYGGKTDYGAC
ncbi:MAG: hypothetical protein RO009_17750 [Pseudorhodoplanes sp.]|jgi:hypothetical protein|nr:hypothetical protein [Pseudorhodoplanes sp.]